MVYYYITLNYIFSRLFLYEAITSGKNNKKQLSSNSTYIEDFLKLSMFSYTRKIVTGIMKFYYVHKKIIK